MSLDALAAAQPAPSATPPADSAAASLATAEFAFAARSVATDMKQAFLSVMTDDAILLRPGPVNGRDAMSRNPAPPIELNWRPAFVHVAASGDFGVSTGPARITFKQTPARAPVYTHFLSIWERQGDVWKLKLDVGIDHAEPLFADAWLTLSQSVANGPGPAALKAVEAAFNATMLKSGYVAALADHADANIRVYRTPRKPMLGKAALAGESFLPAGTIGEILQSGIASSGDLAWTLVKLWAAERPDVPVAHVIRVWRAEGGKFLLLSDLAVAMPESK